MKLVNRAKMTTPTTGTGTITLGSAVAGFQTFASAGVVDGDTVRYVIEDGANWEIGAGTYSSTGPTLTRSLVQSSTGSLLNLSGNATVFLTMTGADVVQPSRQVNTGTGLTGGGDLSANRTLALTGQALAFHNLSSNGIIARTAADTVAARTISGTTDQISVTNGDGVSGNPTIAAVIATQAEAEAGTNNVKLMTPLRTAQAIATSPKVNRQVFNASGTWTKPSGYSANSVVLIQAWGGGGSGRRDSNIFNATGGGGGGYIERWMVLSDLGATETVTIGAGGAARSGSNQDGAVGGNTSFGSHLTAYGGGGGGSGTGGGGGGQLSAGQNNGMPGLPHYRSDTSFIGAGVTYDGSTYSYLPSRPGVHHGGGGGGGSGYGSGAASVYGGGGGGGCTSGAAGGTSLFGGNGGACGTNGTAGQVYTVGCQITTTGGRIVRRNVRLAVKEI
jgi:hypothetical protein